MNTRLMKSLLLGACACLFTLRSGATSAVVLPLEGRLPATPGNTDYQAYYDPNLDITWAAHAVANELMNWDTAKAWAADLTIGGISGWRLPNMDVNGDGTVLNCSGGGVTGCEDNEMGYLFWEEGITDATPGPFVHIAPWVYWSGTEFGPSEVWVFDFSTGSSFHVGPKSREDIESWAVRDGDVIPIPPAVWLFGSGLLGMIGIAGRKKAD